MRILKVPQTAMKMSSLRHECESQKFLSSARIFQDYDKNERLRTSSDSHKVSRLRKGRESQKILGSATKISSL